MTRSTIATASAVLLAAASTSVVNAQTPSKSPSKAPTPSPTDSPTKNFFYPGWGTTQSDTCLQTSVHGTPGEPINSDTSSQYDTLEKCCEGKFLGTYNTCIIEGGGSLVATDKWYIDYGDHSNHKCSKDCEVNALDAACNGIIGKSGTATLYPTAEACCSDTLNHLADQWCLDVSNRITPTGTSKWYVEWTEHLCVQDCPESTSAPTCGGVLDEGNRATYNDVQTCCAQGLPGVTTEYCVAQTNPNNATNLWFLSTEAPDHCKKDCVGTSDICAKAGPYDKLYDTAKKCCDGKLGWVTDEYCVTRSEQSPAYSGKWFVSTQYGSGAYCVKDCNPGTEDSCSNDLTPSDPTFDSPEACCKDKLNWVDKDTCSASSIAGSVEDKAPTNKFYADYADAKRCVKDCDTADPACKRLSEDYVITLYDDATKCCSGKFGWYDTHLCEAISNTGVTNTERWVPDYDGNVESCVQDCNSVTTTCVKPGGQPENFGDKTYETLGKCCQEKINWDVDGCMCRADSSLPECQGDGKYYANDSGDTNICVKNCPVDTANPECGGISTYERPYFDTIEKCCESNRFASLSGIAKCQCEGKDPTNTSACPAAAGSSKWYSKGGKCVQDCPEGQGTYCGGVATWDATFYNSDDACCSSTEFAWTTLEVCLSGTVG